MKDMKWYNTLQFIVLCLTLTLVAIDWGIGLWATVTLAFVTLVKIVAERRVGNPSLDLPLRLALLGEPAQRVVGLVEKICGFAPDAHVSFSLMV